MPASRRAAVAGHRARHARDVPAARLGHRPHDGPGDGRRRRLDGDLQRARRRRPRRARAAGGAARESVMTRRTHDVPVLRRRLRPRRGARGGRRLRDPRRSRASGESRAHVLEGRGARRDARPRRPAAAPRDRRRARELGRGARRRRERLRAHDRGARRRLRRVLRVGPAPDRGLLRRQQAHEGLHRQRQHRHELAACAWRRPSRATSARSAPTPCRTTTRTSSRPSSSCSSARISRGAIPCCSSA